MDSEYSESISCNIACRWRSDVSVSHIRRTIGIKTHYGHFHKDLGCTKYSSALAEDQSCTNRARWSSHFVYASSATTYMSTLLLYFSYFSCVRLMYFLYLNNTRTQALCFFQLNRICSKALKWAHHFLKSENFVIKLNLYYFYNWSGDATVLEAVHISCILVFCEAFFFQQPQVSRTHGYPL